MAFNSKITQLYGITPDELTEKITAALNDQISELKKGIPKNTDDKWLTRKETREMLSVSFPTIHAWSKKGILTAYKIGNKVRYRLSEVQQAIVKVKY